MSKQTGVLQRCQCICKRIFHLIAGSLQTSKGGLCCPVFFHLVLFLAFRHAPFHDGKSLDTLITYYNTRKALFHYIVSRESMIFSNCFRLIWMRLPFKITQPAVGFSSASRRSLFSPIRKYLDASPMVSVYFSQRAFALVTGLLHPRLTSLRHERHQFYTQVF